MHFEVESAFSFIYLRKQQTYDQIFKKLESKALQLKYNFEFDTVHTDLGILKRNFAIFSEGNYSNEIESTISGYWQIMDQQIPYSYYHYHYVDEEQYTATENGKQVKKYRYQHYNRYGVFIFNLPESYVDINPRFSKYYKIPWTTSSIDFNDVYAITGDSEINLAKFFSPNTTVCLQTLLGKVNKPRFIFYGNMACLSFNDNIMDFSKDSANKSFDDLINCTKTIKMAKFEKISDSLTVYLEKVL